MVCPQSGYCVAVILRSACASPNPAAQPHGALTGRSNQFAWCRLRGGGGLGHSWEVLLPLTRERNSGYRIQSTAQTSDHTTVVTTNSATSISPRIQKLLIPCIVQPSLAVISFTSGWCRPANTTIWCGFMMKSFSWLSCYP